jgi:hypothetical protein
VDVNARMKALGCQACAFWRVTMTEGVGGAPYKGTCHLRAPAYIANAGTMFPETNARDWCGEGAPADEVEA